MNYRGYELEFTSAVHIGRRRLDDTAKTFYADTLFSAMCHEALNQGGNEMLSSLISMAKNRNLMISDAFPCYTHNGESRFYIPKPIMRIESKADDQGNSSVKKSIKKLDFIPFDKLSLYLAGEMDVKKEAELYKTIGQNEVRTMSANNDEENTVPFSVGVFRFSDGWKLYIIVATESEEAGLLSEKLLQGLGYSGIGGKRTSGLGKFNINEAKLPAEMIDILCSSKNQEGCFMSLSLGMPEDDIIEEVVREATYGIVRRGGFVGSSTFADRNVKKRNSYLFKAGSVFKHAFDGTIKDVSGEGTHPVYRYSNPIFIEVR